MSPDEIRSRLRTGEDGRTEFKSVQGRGPERDALAKELVAFANSGGGELLLGVEDHGDVTGVGDAKDAETWQRTLSQIARDAIRPALRIALRTVELDARLIVVANVPGHQAGRPFQGRSKYFLRDGPESREASAEELKRILHSAPSSYFDEFPVPDATRDDLDVDAVDRLLLRVGRASGRRAPDAALRSLKLVDATGRPTVAGILLCGREPQAFFMDARVSAVRFPGTTIGSKMADRQEIGGTLVAQLESAVEFIVRHVSAPTSIVGLTRVSTEVPREVWREAITNALCHRDYNATAQVRVFVFDDRVEIINPGTLLNEMTVEGIRLVGTSQRRNPYLTSVLMHLGYAEQLGFGVPEMIRALAESGLPEPDLRAAEGEFRVIVHTRPSGEGLS